MATFVVECEPERLCLLVDKMPDAVVDFGHEVAGVDMQHLVKAVGNMESQSGCEGDTLLHFFGRKPLVVGKGELQFVAVFVYLVAAQDRRDRWQFHMPDAAEVILDLSLFPDELFLVWQDLPFAPTADAIVAATCLAAFGRRGDEACHASLHEGVFLTCDLQIDYITGYAVRHKAHQVCTLYSVSVSGLYSTERFALGGYVGNGDIS